MSRFDKYLDPIINMLLYFGEDAAKYSNYIKRNPSIVSVMSAEVIKSEIEKIMEEQEGENSHKSPLEVFMELFEITDEGLARMIADYFGYDIITKEKIFQIKEELESMGMELLLNEIPKDKAEVYGVIPIRILENQYIGAKPIRELEVAFADPWNLEAEDYIKRAFEGRFDTIKPYYIPEKDFEYVIQIVYGTKLGDVSDIEIVEEEYEEEEVSGPIVEFVNNMLRTALLEGASDIHIEPLKNALRIRFRVDGTLKEHVTFNENVSYYKRSIIARVKVMANMDVTEHRRPLDGRFTTKMPGSNINVDVRVSTLPTVHGEKAVLRLLRKDPSLLKLENIGFEPDVLESFRNLIHQPYGMILVSGPTGSGKSTTLYAALNELNDVTVNIMTAEDPVEYEMPGINQVQVNPKAGLTFANALRSFLRQDPDIILVGEIRDKETAEIAMHAALTGHLVLSTIHTNDAFSAPMRLMDMGIEPFLIASSLIGVLAQRLVKRICSNCKVSISKPDMPETLKEVEQSLIQLGFQPAYFKGEGCAKCNNTGYKGRLAIHELLVIDEDIRKLILNRASGSDVKKMAISKGTRTLLQDGMLKVFKGLTTVEEVTRVVSSLEV